MAQVLVRRELQGYRAVGARYSFNVEEQVLIFITMRMMMNNLERFGDLQVLVIK